MMSEPLELERRLDHEEWIIEREVNIRLVAAGINELPEALPPLLSRFSWLNSPVSSSGSSSARQSCPACHRNGSRLRRSSPSWP